jgi:hypothetical protein
MIDKKKIPGIGCKTHKVKENTKSGSKILQNLGSKTHWWYNNFLSFFGFL